MCSATPPRLDHRRIAGGPPAAEEDRSQSRRATPGFERRWCCSAARSASGRSLHPASVYTNRSPRITVTGRLLRTSDCCELAPAQAGASCTAPLIKIESCRDGEQRDGVAIQTADASAAVATQQAFRRDGWEGGPREATPSATTPLSASSSCMARRPRVLRRLLPRTAPAAHDRLLAPLNDGSLPNASKAISVFGDLVPKRARSVVALSNARRLRLGGKLEEDARNAAGSVLVRHHRGSMTRTCAIVEGRATRVS